MIIMVRSRQRVLLLAATILLFVFSLISLLRHGHPNAALSKNLPDPLSWLPGGEKPSMQRPEDLSTEEWEVKNSDYTIVSSIRNSRGYYNKVDAGAIEYRIMNPTLLELPKHDKIKHDFLVIARTTHIDTEIKDKKYKLARQVAFFANVELTRNDRPIIKADKWARTIVEDVASPRHHCQRQPDMDKYIGPEDMKLFWTRTGEPLLIFTQQIDDEIRCQGQFIIDARAAVPELQQLLDAAGVELPKIRFPEPEGVRRRPVLGEENHPRYQREKNWAPVQSPFKDDKEELLFMVEPSQLYQYTDDNGVVRPIIEEEDQHSAVEAPYPLTLEEGKETWRSELQTCIHDVFLTDAHVHQSTPMLSLTLCNRGKCKPSEDNTVLVGMVQRRYDRPTWYDRRIVLYSSKAPYKMLSVSKKLSYQGETEAGTYAWTGSMVYYTHHKHFPPPNHGFLDDEIWLSFGIKDSDGGWIDVRAKELTNEHYMCEGAPRDFRQHMGANMNSTTGEDSEPAEELKQPREH